MFRPKNAYKAITLYDHLIFRFFSNIKAVEK